MAQARLAAPELAAVEIHGISRGAFITRSALAAGAVYGGAAVSPFVRGALAQDGGGDIDVLNFGLTLEYLEAAFYERGVKKVKGLSGDTRRLAKEIRDNEQEHVDALTAAIKAAGGKPVKAPMVGFGGAYASERSFLKLAQTLEDTGVSAYNGAAPLIKSTDVLAAAGSIVQIEARHAALIRLMRGSTPAPDAFDKTLDKAMVLEAVKPFIKA